jgi:predicted AAA+ superfamily ATPase
MSDIKIKQLPRFLEQTIKEVLKISPCIFIAGARQIGKSTLAIKLIDNYILLDDVSIRESVEKNAIEFIKMQKKPMCFDEVQKMPSLLEAIKINIDNDRNNGDFLLTGSANVFDIKGVGDTLAGRIINLTMYPLTMKEQAGELENCFEKILHKDFSIKQIDVDTQLKMILIGGYPEAIKIKSNKLRQYWFASYISSYIERDARDIGDIRDVMKFIKLFNLLAPRSGGIFNIKNFALSSGIAEKTVANYLEILKLIFQIQTLPPYFSNISKRFVKMPKSYFTDTGVLAHLLNIQTKEEFDNSEYKGIIIETFVFMELKKHIDYSGLGAKIYHYRTTDQKEIDFIIEYKNKLIAIEVKASSGIKQEDFKHIDDLAKKESKLDLGIVFYMGDKILPFGKNFVALPLGFFF